MCVVFSELFLNQNRNARHCCAFAPFLPQKIMRVLNPVFVRVLRRRIVLRNGRCGISQNPKPQRSALLRVMFGVNSCRKNLHDEDFRSLHLYVIPHRFWRSLVPHLQRLDVSRQKSPGTAKKRDANGRGIRVVISVGGGHPASAAAA